MNKISQIIIFYGFAMEFFSSFRRGRLMEKYQSLHGTILISISLLALCVLYWWWIWSINGIHAEYIKKQSDELQKRSEEHIPPMVSEIFTKLA